jgi:hypothetical protein
MRVSAGLPARPPALPPGCPITRGSAPCDRLRFAGRQNATASGIDCIETDAWTAETTLQALTDLTAGAYTHAVYSTWNFSTISEVSSDDQCPCLESELPTLL